MGWARANVYYDTLSIPPPPRSLQEALCMLVHRYRQQQRFHETLLSTVQAGDPETKKYYEEVLEGYRQAMFPYVHRTREDERERTRKALEAAFMKGPIRVRDGRIENG
jgi:hypothetical protein